MRLQSELRQFISDNFLYGQEENPLDDDSSFIDSGIIDSTGILELVAFVQDRYRILVADEELIPAHFDSLNSLAAFIARKSQAEVSPCSDTF